MPWKNAFLAAAQQVQPGLHGESVDGAVKSGLDHRADHVPRRGVRVQVDGGVQGLRGLEYGPELRVVQVLALGVRVDDDALEAELVLAPLDLLGRAPGILRRDRRETSESARVLPAGLRELVVGQGGHGDPSVPVEDLDAGAGQRDDLPVDACRVHVGDPPFAQVLKAGEDGRGTFGLVTEVEAGEAEETGIVAGPVVNHGAPERDQFGRRERLLGRDAEIARLGVHTWTLRHRAAEIKNGWRAVLTRWLHG